MIAIVYGPDDRRRTTHKPYCEKKQLVSYANNKGAYQAAHRCDAQPDIRLVVRYLDVTIDTLASTNVLRFLSRRI